MPKKTLYLLIAGLSAGVLLFFGIGAVVGRKRTESKFQKYTAVQHNSMYERGTDGEIGTLKLNDDDDDELLDGSGDEDDALLGSKFNSAKV